MRKAKIERSVYREKRSVRTASKLYSVRIPQADHFFMFKSKTEASAFLSELEKSINLSLILINQVVSDLYVLYRQNWKVNTIEAIPEQFLQIDKTLLHIIVIRQSEFDTIYKIIRIIGNVEYILQHLNEIANVSKNTGLIHYLQAIDVRLANIQLMVLEFGVNGKWSAFCKQITPKKLY